LDAIFRAPTGLTDSWVGVGHRHRAGAAARRGARAARETEAATRRALRKPKADVARVTAVPRRASC
jgi:hypothetical protein